MNCINEKASFVHSWTWTCQQYPDVCNFLLDKLLSLDVNMHLGEIIWQTHHKEVCLFELPQSMANFRVAVKNYHEHRFWRYFLRPSLAYREACGYNIIEELHIPSVKVLLCGEKRKGVKLEQAYFVTIYEENTSTFEDFKPGKSHGDDKDSLMSLLRTNCRRLALLHRTGYSHGGAHPRNFLWRKTSTGSLETLWLDMATTRSLNVFNRKSLISIDMSDFLECYKLTQDELDDLCELYQSHSGIPARFIAQNISSRKFNYCTF